MIKNKNIFSKLAFFANKLDRAGLYDVADELDLIIATASEDDDYEPLYWSKNEPPRAIEEIEDDIKRMHASINRARTFPTADFSNPEELEEAKKYVGKGETILDDGFVGTLEDTLEELKRELAWAKTQPVDLNYAREYREYKKRYKEQFNTIVKLIEKGNTVVLVTEEYGYAYWLWIPGVSGEKLEQWWKAQHKEPNIHSLGKTIQLVSADVKNDITDIYNVYTATIDEDEFNKLVRPNGEIVRSGKPKNDDYEDYIVDNYMVPDSQMNTENQGYMGGESPIGGGYSGFGIDEAQADDLEQDNVDAAVRSNGLRGNTSIHDQNAGTFQGFSDSYMYVGYSELEPPYK
jgi:hypothetical protein